MRNPWLLPVLVVGLAGCSSGPSRKLPSPVEVALDGPTLRAATQRILDVGPRMVGTPAELEAVEVVSDLFVEAGALAVRREPFVWDAWVEGPASIQVGGLTLPAAPLSPSTPVDDLRAELILDGSGDVSGRVVIASDSGTNRGLQALQLRGAGAVAMVRVTETSDRDGGPLVEVGHTFEGVEWPSLAVDAATGAELRRRVGETASITSSPGILRDHTSWNVVAEVPGWSDELVIVTAHLDSWHPSESAADNALGVGAMVVMARKLMAGPVPRATVRFVATGAEEQGLQGALAYVDAHPIDAAVARLVLNLDVMWSSEGTFIVMADDRETREFALDVAEEEGIPSVSGGTPTPSSDQFPFQIAGAPTFWAGRFGWREYHTEHDTLDRLELPQAAGSLRVQWAVLAEAAGVPR